MKTFSDRQDRVRQIIIDEAREWLRRSELAPEDKEYFINYMLEEAGYLYQWQQNDKTGWCGGGVFVCYQKAGILIGTGETSNGYVPISMRTATPFEFENWAKRKGVWKTNSPVSGDFFCSDEKKAGQTTHVGIVEYVANDGNELHTIEFNFSSQLVSREVRTGEMLDRIRGYAEPSAELAYLAPASRS